MTARPQVFCRTVSVFWVFFSLLENVIILVYEMVRQLFTVKIEIFHHAVLDVEFTSTSIGFQHFKEELNLAGLVGSFSTTQQANFNEITPT